MGAVLAIRPVNTGSGESWQDASDADLLAAASRRSEQAFAVLLQRYYKDVYRVVWRLTGGHADTDDVTQEAFLRLWANPGQVREAKALKGWLLRVASNLVMDRFRKKPMEELEAADEVADGRPSAEMQHDADYVTRCMDEAIADLPDRQKQALTLVHFEHMTNIVAAATMEVSVDALESLLARARRGLKDKLGPRGQMLLGVLENRP
jgi:RNA polymerase sigma-70 factor, ECF subfamily